MNSEYPDENAASTIFFLTMFRITSTASPISANHIIFSPGHNFIRKIFINNLIWMWSLRHMCPHLKVNSFDTLSCTLQFFYVYWYSYVIIKCKSETVSVCAFGMVCFSIYIYIVYVIQCWHVVPGRYGTIPVKKFNLCGSHRRHQWGFVCINSDNIDWLNGWNSIDRYVPWVLHRG